MKLTKYALEYRKGLSSDTLTALERIAMKASYPLQERGGIDGRGGDSVDFLDISIYSIQQMLEEAYRLGKADGERTADSPYTFLRDDTCILDGNDAVDRNDPDRAHEAIEFAVPEGFSDKAKALMAYLDDTGFIFAYKGQLVLTDESLELTQAGGGTHDSPIGGPRAVCNSWDELEKRLEEDYDGMKAEGLI